MSSLSKILAVVLLLLALVLGTLAIFLARATPEPVVTPPLASVPLAPVHQAPTIPESSVVVAARHLPAGTVLGREDVTVAAWRSAPSTSFQTPDTVIGEVLRFELKAGEPVLSGGLVTGLSAALGPGERAVAIAVDDVVGVANQIVPGDWVDVFFSLARLGTDVQRHQARLLLPRLRVLAYGNTSVVGPSATASKAAHEASAPKIAVLAVPVSVVNELLLASVNGRLQLALRAPNDEAVPDQEFFVKPNRVLAVRDGLSPAALTALESPENTAYAGRDLPDLSGPLPKSHTSASAPRQASSSRRNSDQRRSEVEVIRGTEVRREVLK